MKEKMLYVNHCVFHPFDGFYEAKNRGKGSNIVATVLLALYGILQCFSRQYTGFVMNTFRISRINSVTVFISSITVFLLFMVANWTITTLFEGKGKLKDIYMVVCYSLYPVIFVDFFIVILSNYVISEEVVILSAISVMAKVWACFMLVAGLCTVHEYGLAKCLVTILATAISAAIIIFLGVLFISLIEQMISFITTFVKEFIRRIS